MPAHEPRMSDVDHDSVVVMPVIRMVFVRERWPLTIST